MKTLIALTFITSLFTLSVHAGVDVPSYELNHIKSKDGVALVYESFGNEAGKPVVLVHAWSQSTLGWLPLLQNEPFLEKYHVISLNLRGHGGSNKPIQDDAYDNAQVWADDLDTLINQLDADDVTLVGWSYGTIAIADYVSKYGDKKLHAINFVAGLSGLNVPRISHYFGDAFNPVPVITEDALAESVNIASIVDIMVPASLDKETYAALIASNMQTSATARGAMLNRQIDHKLTYQNISVPVLFSHGAKDNAVKLIAAQEGLGFVKNGRLSVYEDANHGPHWFEPERFAQELDHLITTGNNAQY